MKNIDINKIVVSNKVYFGKKKKKLLNILLATKILKKIKSYVYFSHKCVHLWEKYTLQRLNIYLSK